jgi:hypothetical protein
MDNINVENAVPPSPAGMAPSPARPLGCIFDDSHYTSSFWQKIKRSIQLGPKYYACDVPRYFLSRKALQLPFWDLGVLLNPLREFRRRTYQTLPLPPGYVEALQHLAAAGVRLTMPQGRLEALLGAWSTTHEIAGDVIECGSYQGATALLLAVLGRINQVRQRVLMLDTFAGTPSTSSYDLSRRPGEFLPSGDQVAQIRRQAENLQVSDRIEIHKGLFRDSFARLVERDLRFAFVHIDANIFQGTWEACQFAIPRTAPGGVIVFDDYNGVCDLGARLAIDRFCAGQNRTLSPLSGSSVLMRILA